jgi:hypothetical protein
MAKQPDRTPAHKDILTGLTGGKNLPRPTFADQVIEEHCEALLAGIKIHDSVQLAEHAMRELCYLDDRRERLAGNNAMKQRICVNIEIACIETVERIQRETYDPWSLK